MVQPTKRQNSVQEPKLFLTSYVQANVEVITSSWVRQCSQNMKIVLRKES
jgi:hypothetical protein